MFFDIYCHQKLGRVHGGINLVSTNPFVNSLRSYVFVIPFDPGLSVRSDHCALMQTWILNANRFPLDQTRYRDGRVPT
jgi:hypothetical protein